MADYKIGTVLICLKDYGGTDVRELVNLTERGYEWRSLGSEVINPPPGLDPYFDLPVWIPIEAGADLGQTQKAVLEVQQGLIQKLQTEVASLRLQLTLRGG